MSEHDWQTELEQRFDLLSLEDKMLLIEQLVRRIRHGMMDHAALERGLQEMAQDAEFLRAAGMDNPPLAKTALAEGGAADAAG